MASPEKRGGPKPYSAPAWMLEASRKKLALSGNSPAALNQKMREYMTNNPSIGPVHIQRLPKKVPDLPLEAAPTSNATFDIPERPAAAGEAQTIEGTHRFVVPARDVDGEASANRRITHVKKRDERRASKAKVRANAVVDNARDVASQASPPVLGQLSLSTSLFVPGGGNESKYRHHPSLPVWLTSISIKSFEYKQLEKRRSQTHTALDSLKSWVGYCEMRTNPHLRAKAVEGLRDQVHKAEFLPGVSTYLIKKTKMLDPEIGLPRIFKEDATFPPDLKADSYQLYNRWYRGELKQDILRGIITKKGSDRGGDKFDPTYRKQHSPTARYYGEGDLVLGQWWPTQLTACRDGAHGATQGGIYGETDKGAYSIVLAGGGGYNDQDNGNTIKYSGTAGKDHRPTEATNHLIKSKELQNVIRVLRSSNLDKKEKKERKEKKTRYCPEQGYRYDGLYRVTDFVLEIPETAMYRFSLVRCEGQEPIRCEDNAARRPTYYELEEYRRLREEKNWE